MGGRRALTVWGQRYDESRLTLDEHEGCMGDKIAGLPVGDESEAVYLIGDSPEGMDKPLFDFSNVSYAHGRESGVLQTKIQQKGKQLQDASLGIDIEDLAEKLEELMDEQEAYVAKHGHEKKSLTARIQAMEKRIETWEAPDLETLQREWDALMKEQERFILAAVKYVPQSWLINAAPPAHKIDWKQPESMQWLRVDKLQALAKAKQEAQNNPN